MRESTSGLGAVDDLREKSNFEKLHLEIFSEMGKILT